jgi:hypothetical protein
MGHCSTHHTVLNASPGTAIFVRDVAYWKKIGDYRQHQTNLNAAPKNSTLVNYDYKVGDKVLVKQDGILRKAESSYSKMPWTITTIFTNETIRIQCGTKSERINIRKVTPFSDK